MPPNARPVDMTPEEWQAERNAYFANKEPFDMVEFFQELTDMKFAYRRRHYQSIQSEN